MNKYDIIQASVKQMEVMERKRPYTVMVGAKSSMGQFVKAKLAFNKKSFKSLGVKIIFI